MQSHRVGKIGEWAVRLWLRLRGYRILTHNSRHGGVEVDVVAHRGSTLHLIEVKSRSRADAWSPGSAVGRHKRARLQRAARHLLRAPAHHTRAVSFDVAEVWLLPWPRVRLITDAFRCEEG